MNHVNAFLLSVAAAEAADAVKGGSEELERLRGELEVYQVGVLCLNPLRWSDAYICQ